jgi:hypothetical protein
MTVQNLISRRSISIIFLRKSIRIAIYYQIISEWILFYYYEYYNGNEDFDRGSNSDNAQIIFDILPFNLSDELKEFYKMYDGNHPLTPQLTFYPLIESCTNLITGLSDRPALILLTGNRGEIYYVICPDTPEIFSPVYCKVPDKEPVLYAECLTSWIVAIAQCYQEGAYYIEIDPDSGAKKIEQDLDKVEAIFEKFNPNQIDAWRSIWKES